MNNRHVDALDVYISYDFGFIAFWIFCSSKQVFDALRTTMFILGMMSVFVGISLLAPDESKGSNRIMVVANFIWKIKIGTCSENLQVVKSKIIHL